MDSVDDFGALSTFRNRSFAQPYTVTPLMLRPGEDDRPSYFQCGFLQQQKRKEKEAKSLLVW